MKSDPAYAWYQVVADRDLAQGNFFEACPVFIPPPEIPFDSATPILFDWETRDVVVMTQSCDLATGREKVNEVLVCPVWELSQFTAPHYLSTAKGLEEARRGYLPGFHLLAACALPNFIREIRIVDFRQIHSLPLAYLRHQAGKSGPRLRLLPPYREHLVQAFARFFMRVGLPVDIPAFR